MSDEFEDTMPDEEDGDEEEGTAETQTPTDEVSDFLSDVQAEGSVAPEATVITVQTSGGETRYVPTDTSLTIKDLLSKAGLMIGGAVEFWLNGAKLQSTDEIIPIGGKLVVVGSVKGG